ncbi:MAG: PBP1A family penicillin-binding protein [Alphaproteobacteria bacterium]|nr:PBP1A family penicillin-binding protein [Alphaproteobacteria bacterium]
MSANLGKKPKKQPRKKRSQKKRSRKKKTRNYSLWVLWGLVVCLTVAVYFLYDLPHIDRVKPLDVKPSIALLANDGTLIARYGGIQGDKIEMTDVPHHLIEAVLSVEDRRFYSHFGIDPKGLARAIWVNVRALRWMQGGSTITQQLAKNMFLTPERTIRRKVQEALMAFQIERKFTKDEILLAYLNRVYFGSGAYGVDAAAKTYFSKPVSRVTLWEGAVLAGLLKAPSRFSPAAHPKRAAARAKVVIGAMKDAGYIDAKKMSREIGKIRIRKVRSTSKNINRYFADWVIGQIDGFLYATDSDIVVRTTLDSKLQLMAETKQKALFKKFSSQNKISQVALLTEAYDGAVLAMIGGVDYAASQFNRATQAKRQPGSAFKPFVYLAALESGLDPDTKIEDAPIKEGAYRPANYAGKYYGTVTLTQALSRSMNTATIRLLRLVGVSRLLDVADRMGFANRPKPELASGLGTSEVSLLELTSAYAVIANGGVAVWPYAVLSISDAEGRLLYKHEHPERAQVFSVGDIKELDGMLKQVVADGTGRAAQLSRYSAAGKTGTTQNYRDAWFVGYTGKFVTGVWMGNDDNASMNRVTGGKYPAQLWHDYMNATLDFNVPVFVPKAYLSTHKKTIGSEFIRMFWD